MKLAWVGMGLALAGCASTPKLQANVADDRPGRSTVAAAIEAEPEAKAETVEAKPEPEAAQDLPTACDHEDTFGKTKLCLPSAAYAKKLCSGIYPEVALGLFGKGTPWTRVYLAGDVDAWNASGGLTHRAQLAFDEEVVVLAKRTPSASGGIVMTGMQASLDILRWDGSCVSVMEGELTAKKPPQPKPAAITFSRLEESTRHALLETPKIKRLHDELGKACASSERSRCEKADHAFGVAIADLVRAGITLPVPARRP